MGCYMRSRYLFIFLHDLDIVILTITAFRRTLRSSRAIADVFVVKAPQLSILVYKLSDTLNYKVFFF